AQIAADFAADNKTGCLPLIINFTDQSTGSPTSWYWDFGNGNSSTKQNPSANYIKAGVFSITLIASNSSFSDTVKKVAYISVYANPISSFTADTISGCSPITVNFTDESVPVSSSIKEWYWDFGDGYFSRNPSAFHTYTLSGLYTVSLLITDGNGCQDFFFIEKYIKVNKPDAGFIVPELKCNIPADIQFINNSNSDKIDYYWDFGDGGIDTIKDPIHTFQTIDTFTIKSIVSDELGCADTVDKVMYFAGFKADFDFNITVLCDSIIKAEFTDATVPGATSWYWDLGNNKNTTRPNFKYTYDPYDSYNVTLISTINSDCIDTITKNIYNPPKANYSMDTNYSCRTPFLINFDNLSTGSHIISYYWDFGNGDTITSLDSILTRTFTTPSDSTKDNKKLGGILVYLIAKDSYGCVDSTFDTVEINLPVAKFLAFDSIDGVGGCVTLDVLFTDKSKSKDTILFWSWALGNDSVSSDQNPSTTYIDTGKFDVTLSIINEKGCSASITKEEFVEVGIKPDFANFTTAPLDTGCFDNEMCFFDLSGFNDTSIKVNDWFWDFWYFPSKGYGVGTFFEEFRSYAKNPCFGFGHLMGEDTVHLAVGHNGCYDSIWKPIIIVPPIAEVYIHNPDYTEDQPKFTLAACSPPIGFWFRNTSGMYTSIPTFEIIDLQTADTTLLNPDPGDSTYIYFTKPGEYLVKIIARNDTTRSGGCEMTNIHNIMRFDSVTPGFDVTPKKDCLPNNAFTFIDTSVSYFGIKKGWFWDFGDGDSLLNYYIKPEDTILIYRDITTLIPDTIIIPDRPIYTHLGTDQITKNDNHDGYTSGFYENPTHIYRDTGTYIVKLLLTVAVTYRQPDPDTLRCYYETLDTIRVDGAFARIGLDSLVKCAFSQVNFIDSSFTSSNIIKRVWDFADSSSIDTIPNPIHTFSSAGDYNISLSIMDSVGCTDTIYREFIFSYPDLDFVAVPVSPCPGDTVSFDNKSTGEELSYLWQFGDATTDTLQNPIHKYSTTGFYTVSLTAIDTNSCADTLTFADLIKALEEPVAGFQANITSANCPPLPVLFSDNSTNAVQWLWDFGDGQSSNLQNPSHLYTQSDSFDVLQIVTNTIGCSDTATKENYIKILGPSGTLSFKPDSGCLPFNVNFMSNTKNVDYYFWDFGDGNIEFITYADGGDTTLHLYEQSGSFTPSLILKDVLGCTFIIPSTKTLYIEKLMADFSYSYNNLCDLDQINFSDTIKSAFPTIREWDFGDGSKDTISNPKYSYKESGSYIIQLKVTNLIDSTCYIIKKDTIDVYAIPNIRVLADSIGCIPLSVEFSSDTFATNTIITLWIWDFGEGTSGTGKFVTHTFSYADSFTVKLSAYYAKDSCKIDTIFIIRTLNVPDADFTFDPAKPSIKNPIIDFSDLSTNATTWLWDFGTGDTDNSKDPFYTYENSGHYTIKLIVTNENQCLDTVIKPIFIAPKAFIDVPTAFTPNNDGNNDRYYAFHAGIKKLLEFKIFNRWGELVFETDDINEGWDGTLRGKPQDMGTYVYYIVANSFISEEPVVLKGNFTLIR
ncbi:PKD domain-containing protein, partial [Bacteroidales bacterium AH-315-N07]|nr:PKD domain-containing protein [Bacteroidales bacterium AH-315-N07]